MLESMMHIIPAAGVAAVVIALQEAVKFLCDRYLERACSI